MDLNQSRKQLEELGVDSLIKFGSQVNGTARPDSDCDIGVVFSAQTKVQPRRYGQVYAILQQAYPQFRVDLVDLYQAPPALQYHTAQHGEVLYQASTHSFADFRERAMATYHDFLPIIHIQEQALQI
ncbi:MAG: nucleotidyltransferase domain-containing protein [Candidatus Kerfeldbacteria bacterium]|nr:nucleotidyltransferase domain-containing protein [Candidatus Kerfeldbacteria bacterium]